VAEFVGIASVETEIDYDDYVLCFRYALTCGHTFRIGLQMVAMLPTCGDA
jgi:hypothetical protein